MAKAFNLPLELDPETIKRMHAGLKSRGMDPDAQTPDQRKARERMALLPTGEGSEIIFVAEEKWVPVVRLGGKVGHTRYGTFIVGRIDLSFSMSLALYLPGYSIAFRTTLGFAYTLPASPP
jgi:hypothetical protein